MLSKINGAVSVMILILNTICTAFILFPVALLKFCLPFKKTTVFFNKLLNKIANDWVYRNNLTINLTKKINWCITGDGISDPYGRYLVISNHQSWVDIVILQKVLYGKIPFIKFFLKKELIRVPILGLAWWALDFPFMKRYSKEFIARNPHLKGKDIEITRKACEKFKIVPVSIMNFVEGTRFCKGTHDRQKSPYINLLKPRSGGVGYMLSAMGDYLTGIINVTIAYPSGKKDFWSFLCGQIKEIMVDIQKISFTKELLGDYINDTRFQEFFQNWLNGIWNEKDKKLSLMLGENSN